jgi:hypothetical protein
MTLATRASQAAHVRAIVEPVTLFDMLLSKFPYLPSCDVLIPPTNGWPQDDISNFRKLGKTDLVVEVLKSLPYIVQVATVAGDRGALVTMIRNQLLMPKSLVHEMEPHTSLLLHKTT